MRVTGSVDFLTVGTGARENEKPTQQKNRRLAFYPEQNNKIPREDRPRWRWRWRANTGLPQQPT
jgi:hypothetical protein